MKLEQRQRSLWWAAGLLISSGVGLWIAGVFSGQLVILDIGPVMMSSGALLLVWQGRLPAAG